MHQGFPILLKLDTSYVMGFYLLGFYVIIIGQI